jgi:hypothetical protein
MAQSMSQNLILGCLWDAFGTIFVPLVYWAWSVEYWLVDYLGEEHGPLACELLGVECGLITCGLSGVEGELLAGRLMGVERGLLDLGMERGL